MFGAELHDAVDTGKLDKQLFSIVGLICLAWQSDSQRIEGLNSRVKYYTTKSPRIGLQTLSANVVATDLCNIGVRGFKIKWSEIKPAADHVADTAYAAYNKQMVEQIAAGFLPRQADIGEPRFATPQPTEPRDRAQHRRYSETDRWIAACSLQIYKLVQPRVDVNCIRVGVTIQNGLKAAPPEVMWISPSVYYSMCYLLKLEVVRSSGDFDVELALSNPLVFCTASEVCSSLSNVVKQSQS